MRNHRRITVGFGAMCFAIGAMLATILPSEWWMVIGGIYAIAGLAYPLLPEATNG